MFCGNQGQKFIAVNFANWSDCVGTVQTYLSKGDTRNNDANFAKLCDFKANSAFVAVNEKFRGISLKPANFTIFRGRWQIS